MLTNTSINRSSSKAVGLRRGLKFVKNDRSKDIGIQMFLMGDKMFKYIVKFSLRFTECFYEVICLYQFDSFCHKIKDILWGL